MRLKSFLQFFTRGWRKSKPINNKPSRIRSSRLLVELLEKRELLAGNIPTIIATGVLPVDGSSVGTSSPIIQVEFSEAMSNSAQTASNYVLLGSSGNNITINSATFFNSPVNSIVRLTYNGGAGLVVDNYTLFVRGDQLIDADDGFAMAQPGQIIAANGGRNSVSVASMPGDGSIGTLANYTLPPVAGVTATPVLTLGRDVDGDGIPDLLAYTRNSETIEVFQGLAGGGYHQTPDLTLSLPPGTNTFLRSLAVADFNGDGKLDMAAANFDNNMATVFLNTRTSIGTLGFDTGTSFLVDANPTGIVAEDLDADGKIDLALSFFSNPTDLNADGNNDYRIEILPGNGAGGFTAAPIRVRVGDAAGGMVQPFAIVAGLLDPNSALPQIALGGPQGILIVKNTSTPGTFTMTPQPKISLAQSMHLVLGNFDAGNTLDIAAPSVLPAGMAVLRNIGNLQFQPAVTFPIVAGFNFQPAAGDLNQDGRDDIVVPSGSPGNAVTVMISSIVGGNISAATNVPLADIVITSANHHLTVGQPYTVLISGALGNTNANGPHAITVIDSNTFSLNGVVGNGAYTGGGMWELTGTITSATGPGGNLPIVITTASTAGLTTGSAVTITGNALGAANGTFIITVASPTTFVLNGTVASGTGAGGTWVTTTKFITPLLGTVGIATAAGGGAAIVITTPSTAKLATGNVVTITGSGLPAANGTFAITVTGPNTFTLNGTNPASAASGVGGTCKGATDFSSVATVYGVDADPNSADLVDTNQDGHLDLITANTAGTDFTVMLGSGDGTFRTPFNTSLTPTATSRVASADLNADGIPDLIVIDNNSTNSGTQVSVMQGLVGGGYGAPLNFSPLPPGFGQNMRSLSSVAVGDIDFDGRPDIVVTDSQDNSVGFLHNAITPGANIIAGSFTALNDVSVGRTPTQVALADFNGDFKLDLAVAHNGGGGFGNRRGVTVRLGNGDGTFQPSAEYDNNRGMTGIVVGDFNHDGNMDFVASELPGGFGAGNIWINYGDGAGGFSSGQSFSTGIPSPGTIKTADFNNDGFLDIIVASTSSQLTNVGVAVLLNQLGTGFGGGLQSDAAPGYGLTSMVTTDINEDGFVDAIVAASRSGSISGATIPSDIIITSNNHGLTTGQRVYVVGVRGNTAANGSWTVTVLTANTFRLNGSTGNGTYSGGGTWTVIDNNVFVMRGKGNGTFETPVPYLLGGVGGPANPPTYLAATPIPLIRVTTFSSGGTVVNTNLIRNGDFEARDLNGEQGNLLGWQTFDLNASPGGSHGGWLPQTGTTSPLSSTSVVGPTGKFRAMLDQNNQIPYTGNNNPNSPASYEGSHALYQDITIPANAAKVSLSLSLYIDNTDAGAYTDTTTPPSLNFNISNPATNQQVRVDIMRPTASQLSISTTPLFSGNVANASGLGGGNAIVITTPTPHNLTTGTLVTISGVAGFAAANGTFTITFINATQFSLNNSNTAGSGTGGAWIVPGDVLRNEFITTTTTQLTFNGIIQDLDLSAFAGQTIRLRIASANNQGRLIVGVDNVKLNVQFADNVGPTLTGLNVSNPAFVDVNNIPHTNDPTIVGTIADNSGLAGISFVAFDPNNDGFGGADDFKITNWDFGGNFRFTLPSPPAGLDTIGVRVVDKAGNFTSTTFTFFMQSNSVSEWEAVGPQGIDVTGQNNVDFTTVSGRITVTVPDLNDPLGNSYFIGSANGGIWKTTDGGSHWVAVTNAVTDGTGNPIPVPIGGMAQSISNPSILYASTGVGDRELDSRPGVGVLKSTDGGKTWTLIGDSGTVLGGALTTKLVVDQSDPNIAYVAVAAGGNATATSPGGPGVYKTTDGGLHWKNVLDPVNMFFRTNPTNPASLVSIGPGPVDSVTDLIIDPADHTRLIIGLGRVGLAPAGGTTGVWYSPQNSGAGWLLVQGGDNPAIPNNGLPNEFAAGNVLGRITLGIGGGRTGNEGYVYALIGTVPGNNTPPNVDFGAFSGLYRTKDNMLNWTKVMLRQDVAPGGNHSFVNINLLSHDAANAGAMLVDPNNPNVVYIGGSSRWSRPGDPPNHTLIRVDTGNMSDTSGNNNGDDKSKAFRAATQGNFYDPQAPTPSDPYTGEGVYWYDLATNESTGTGNLNSLPPAITSLALDAQGRLLVGTIGGIWRGVGYGFGYDFTSGGSGILQGGGGPGGQTNFNPPAMTFTSINSNLQIADMTSVAIDPFNRGVLYTTQNDTGVAGSTAPLVWVSQGLTGPTVNGVNLGIPNAGSVLTSNPAPTFLGNIIGVTGTSVSPIVITADRNHGLLTGQQVTVGSVGGNLAANGTFTITVVDATRFSLNGTAGTGAYTTGGYYGTPAPAGTPVSLFRIWQFANQLALQPETSSDNGANWSSIQSTGISVGATAGIFPAFAINPNPLRTVDGSGNVLFQTVLAFGANVVYTTNSGATVWDQAGGVLSPGNNITALAFAPSDPDALTLYAATTDGKFFYTNDKGGTGWKSRFTGLPTGLPNTYIKGIAVDPLNANEVFVTYGGTGTPNHVWRSTDAGLTWTNISATLPSVPAYAMVIDRKAGLGAPGGKLYLATEVGAFYSLDDGNTWTRLGQGMPNVPVVDLKYDAGLNVLAAATLGRGVYTINTSAFSFIADQIVDENTPSKVIPFTINNSGTTAYTLTAVSDNQFLVKNSSITLGGLSPSANRTIQFTPVLNAYSAKDGVANITVTIVSGGFTYQQSFKVTVNFVNQLPTISPIANPQTTLMNSPITINFTVGDVETAAGTLIVAASSNNTVLAPNANLVLGGSGPNRTLTITPALNQVGSTTINISVTDSDFGITNRSFTLLVISPASLPFTDDFNRPNSTFFLGPYWTVNTGPVTLNTNAANIGAGLGIASLTQLTPPAANIAVQADVDVGISENLGLLARYNGGVNNFYWGAIVNNGSAYSAVIYKNVGGAFTLLASTPVLSGIGALRFEVAGDSLKLFYNAGAPAGSTPTTLVAFANDTSLPGAGTAGFRSSNGNVILDNFAATAINLTTPILPFSDAFDQANGTQLSDNWINRAGNFAAAGNVMVANSQAPVSLATIAGLNQANASAQVDVNVVGSQNQAGVVVRYSANGYYYAQMVNTGSGFSANIYKAVGNTFTAITAGPVNVTSIGAAGTVRLEVVGSSFKMFYGTSPGSMTLVNYGYDATFASGSTGMRAFGGMTMNNFLTDAITLKTPNLLPFHDDFSTAVNGDQLYGDAAQLTPPNERNWQDLAGDFLVAGGILTGNSSGAAKNFAIVAGNIGDTSVTADLVVDSAVGQEAGVVARYTANGYYYAQIRSTGTGFVATLFKASIVNGATTFTQLNAAPVAVAGSGIVTLEATGPSLKLYFGGALVAYGFDTSFASGAAGVRASKGATTAINDFVADTIGLTSPAALPFTDDFSLPVNGDQLSRNWTERQGNFNINGSQQVVGQDAGMNIATINGPALADASVQVDIVTGAPSQNVSLMARYQANGSYYLAGVVSNAAQTVFTPYILKFIPGSGFLSIPTTLVSPAVPLAATGVMRFEVAGTSLKLFWGGQLVTYGYDSQLAAAGLTGLRTSKNVILDNFTIDTIAPATPAVPFMDDFGTPVNGNQLFGVGARDWDERAGNFIINASNELVADNAAGASIATVHTAPILDAAVQADVNLGPNQITGLVARYQGNSNYYTAVLAANAGATASTAYFFKFINGAFTQIGATAAISAAAGTMRFEVIGNELKLFFTPTAGTQSLVNYAFDTGLPGAGLVGIRSFKGAILDNFTGNAITLVTPTPGLHTFADDFSTPANTNQLYGDVSQLTGNDQRNWEERLGNFTIDGSGQAVAKDASYNIATVHGISIPDASVEADVILTAGQHAGVVARYQADGTFYVGLVQANAAGTSLQPYIFTNKGGFTQLNPVNTPAIPITLGSPNNLRFEVAGTSLKLFVNDILVTYAFNSAITAAGLTGIRASQNGIMDNFVLDQITLNAPTLPYADGFTGLAGDPLSRDWTERQGQLNQNGTGGLQATAPGVTSIATVNTPVADSSTQIDINIPPTGTHNDGLVARYDAVTGNTYVGTLFTSNGVTTAYLFKRIGGTFTQIGNAVNIAALGAGTVRLDVVGNNIKLFYTAQSGPNAGVLTLATYANDTALTAPGFSGVYLGSGETAANFNLSAIALTTPTLAFTDTFTGATGNQLTRDWYEQAGNYGIVGNKIVGNSTILAPGGFNLATVNGINLAAVNVDAEVIVAAGQHAGVVARYQANGSFYTGIVVGNGGGSFTAYLFRYDAGVGYKQLASTPVATGTGTLGLRAVGANLKLFYGTSLATQTLIAYAYDTTYATGKVGIRSTAGANLDTFTVSQVNVPVSQPPTFTETFAVSPPTQQLSTNWTERAGNFSVATGPALGTVGAVTSVNGGAPIAALNGASIATVNGISVAGADLNAIVNIASAGQSASLLARYSGTPGADTYYAAVIQFVSTNNYKVEIDKVVNGVKTVLTTTNVAAFTSGLRFLIVNGNLNVYLDNSALPALTVLDNSITGTGAVGMGATLGAKISKFTAN